MQVHESRGDWKTLDGYYCDLLARTSEPNARLHVLIRIGLLCEFRLDDPGRAALFYKDAIDTAPLGRTLLAAELRAARREGGPKMTVRSLWRLGTRATDARLRLGYMLLAALRGEVASRAPNAALFLEMAEPGRGDPGVTDGLIRALGREAPDSGAGSVQKLADALVERAQACGSAPARALLLLEAAFLFERLGAPRDAALAYDDAGRAAPDFLPILRGILRLALLNEQWPATVALLAREAEVAAHQDNRASAFLQAGEIATTQLNDTRSALGYYRRLLDLQPEHERAYLRATTLYERLGDHQGLFDVLATRAQATKDPEARAVILRRQAELQRDHLNDPSGAVATLRHAIALNGEDVEAWLMLAPLQEQQRWWQDAAASWQKIAELTAGQETSRTARMREAEIRQRELGDREAARSILEELIVDPDDREAMRAMAQLCERMGQWERARELYTQLAQTSKNAPERAQHLLSLSSVLEGGFSDGQSGQRAVDEAFALALGDGEVVAALEGRYGQLGDWRGYVQAGERAFSATRVVAPPQSALRLSLARVYAEELRRFDLAARQLGAASELAPHDPTPVVRLGRMHLESGRPELASPQFRRALTIDPLHPHALRCLGTALLHEGLAEAGQTFDQLAAWIEEGRLPASAPNPHLPRLAHPEDLLALVPITHSQPMAAVAGLIATLEPFAPAILVEATGHIPRGDELPEANQISLRLRAIAQALGVPPMRVFVDPPEGREVKLCADDRLAITAAKDLLRSDALGLLLFESARTFAFVAARATLAASGGPGDLLSLLQAVALEEEGSDHVKELRRRVLRVIPRRLRKDAEKITAEQIHDLPREVVAWYAEELRFTDRIAFLLSRDAVSSLRAIVGDEPSALRRNPRAIDLLRFIESEESQRAAQLLQT
jgi:tetratricopeptide (TPR) repeat protein